MNSSRGYASDANGFENLSDSNSTSPDKDVVNEMTMTASAVKPSIARQYEDKLNDSRKYCSAVVNMTAAAEMQLRRSRSLMVKAVQTALEVDGDSSSTGKEILLFSMLREAATCGSLIACEMLLSNEKLMTEIDCRDMSDILHTAIANGHTDIVLSLLRSGRVGVNDRIKVGKTIGLTALHVCSHSGNADSARLLLSFGADHNALAEWEGDPEGRIVSKTPLDIAKKSGNREIIALLQEVEANPERTMDTLKQIYESQRYRSLLEAEETLASNRSIDQQTSPEGLDSKRGIEEILTPKIHKLLTFSVSLLLFSLFLHFYTYDDGWGSPLHPT